MTDAATVASNLLAARSQMAFTLGFHILLVPFGLCLPLFALIANAYGLRHRDEAALRLARRWSQVMGVTFAVGAVTGTVLSFEMGLLWPGLLGRFGDVFGLPFAIEGIAFFLEAIFVAIYIFGWDRLNPRVHLWLGFPLPFFAALGAFSIISANSWMNTPRGFSLDAAGKVTAVDPWAAIFNPALPHELAHFILAALLVAGFVVAAVYAVGMLKGRRDRLHRLGFLIPFTIAAIAMPLQMLVGDRAMREVVRLQPVKFAAIEMVAETATHVPERLGGRMKDGVPTGGIPIPDMASLLTGFSADTKIVGLNAVAARRSAALHHRPPGVRRDGGRRERAVAAGALVRRRLVAEARPAALALVPARRGRRRAAGHAGAGGGVGHDRGGAPALGRLRGPAHRRRRHARPRDLGLVRGRRRDLRRRRDRPDPRPARDVAPLAHQHAAERHASRTLRAARSAGASRSRRDHAHHRRRRQPPTRGRHEHRRRADPVARASPPTRCWAGPTTAPASGT